MLYKPISSLLLRLRQKETHRLKEKREKIWQNYVFYLRKKTLVCQVFFINLQLNFLKYLVHNNLENYVDKRNESDSIWLSSNWFLINFLNFFIWC